MPIRIEFGKDGSVKGLLPGDAKKFDECLTTLKKAAGKAEGIKMAKAKKAATAAAPAANESSTRPTKQEQALARAQSKVAALGKAAESIHHARARILKGQELRADHEALQSATDAPEDLERYVASGRIRSVGEPQKTVLLAARLNNRRAAAEAAARADAHTAAEAGAAARHQEAQDRRLDVANTTLNELERMRRATLDETRARHDAVLAAVAAGGGGDPTASAAALAAAERRHAEAQAMRANAADAADAFYRVAARGIDDARAQHTEALAAAERRADAARAHRAALGEDAAAERAVYADDAIEHREDAAAAARRHRNDISVEATTLRRGMQEALEGRLDDAAGVRESYADEAVNQRLENAAAARAHRNNISVEATTLRRGMQEALETAPPAAPADDGPAIADLMANAQAEEAATLRGVFNANANNLLGREARVAWNHLEGQLRYVPELAYITDTLSSEARRQLALPPNPARVQRPRPLLASDRAILAQIGHALARDPALAAEVQEAHPAAARLLAEHAQSGSGVAERSAAPWRAVVRQALDAADAGDKKAAAALLRVVARDALLEDPDAMPIDRLERVLAYIEDA